MAWVVPPPRGPADPRLGRFLESTAYIAHIDAIQAGCSIAPIASASPVRADGMTRWACRVPGRFDAADH